MSHDCNKSVYIDGLTSRVQCTAKKFDEMFETTYSFNMTRKKTIPPGIAAYRSALTLDWLAAEDTRQRELVAAVESEPFSSSKIGDTDCMAYTKPTAGSVARLMLELMMNLEGDDGILIPDLVEALVRTRLLAVDPSALENEPDLDSLVNTPNLMLGEPHTTFPRIIATLWMAITDSRTVKKYGWCTTKNMRSFLLANRPTYIAKHMRAVEPIIARARFVMEEFIQHVTPLNMKPSLAINSKPVANKIHNQQVRQMYNLNMVSKRKMKRTHSKETDVNYRTTTTPKTVTTKKVVQLEVETEPAPVQETIQEEFEIQENQQQEQQEQDQQLQQQLQSDFQPEPEPDSDPFQSETNAVSGVLTLFSKDIRVYGLPFNVFVFFLVIA